ncbi:hypothetical protein SDC9_175676 [bioreactor metagenome]|uniref:Uncharacterized protein n=1 Tax=bioreactor metagenome TaxID=1076179 RepID=A0A645GND5_9ZZZZ
MFMLTVFGRKSKKKRRHLLSDKAEAGKPDSLVITTLLMDF